MLAGAAATASAVSVMHPLDTIKVHMQRASSSSAAAGAKHSIASSFRSIVGGGGGVRGLYRGVGVSVAGQGPAGAVKFAVYEGLTQAVGPRVPADAKVLADFACAAAAFVACSVVLLPAEVLKQRLQAGVYASVGEGVREVARQEGVRGFYRGWTATCVRDVPYSMLDGEAPHLHAHVGSGDGGGGFPCFFLTPFVCGCSSGTAGGGSRRVGGGRPGIPCLHLRPSRSAPLCFVGRPCRHTPLCVPMMGGAPAAAAGAIAAPFFGTLRRDAHRRRTSKARCVDTRGWGGGPAFSLLFLGGECDGSFFDGVLRAAAYFFFVFGSFFFFFFFRRWCTPRAARACGCSAAWFLVGFRLRLPF
ncbi:hypothetical protein BU14_0374s0004 [Porphyra umbilicalis]|uniref:Uncharacterized protein n=1 Tax=Porphyra umbilicalis TaxID=2786 RepID=A0A1X6NX78_PORUM|nr:hypothetical protein BU14_0374s0004 [Porphyra umbilicalis]|eukprot:OSX73130.1 hypothetical protein BU14_0374s0004 [Porphyra umbilicalis]